MSDEQMDYGAVMFSAGMFYDRWQSGACAWWEALLLGLATAATTILLFRLLRYVFRKGEVRP